MDNGPVISTSDSKVSLAARQAALLSCIVFVVCANPAAQPAGDREQRITLFTRYLEPLRIQAGIPGLSAAIMSNRGIIGEGGFGFADVEGRE